MTGNWFAAPAKESYASRARAADRIRRGAVVAPALHRSAMKYRGERHVYTFAVILVVLWLLGFVSGYTIGAFIHVLLVVAIVLFLAGLLSGRRVV